MRSGLKPIHFALLFSALKGGFIEAGGLTIFFTAALKDLVISIFNC